MNAKHGHVFVNDVPATKPEDWNSAFVTHSTHELRQVVVQRTRGGEKYQVKEQVAEAKPNLPVYLDDHIQNKLAALANAKGKDLSVFVNELLRKDIELIEIVQ
jgi:hypothetical protein